MENQIGVNFIPDSQNFKHTIYITLCASNILQTQDDFQHSTGIPTIGLFQFSLEFVILRLSNESSWCESLLELQCDIPEL